MERSESAGINPSVNGEQTSFQNAGTESFSASGDTSGAGTTESDTGIKGRVRNVASTVKDKASGLPSIIADGLEAGANALRQNRSSGAETTSGGSVALTNDSSIAAVTDTLATGMQSSADWIRDADMDKLKAGVEKQVKEHPARTLLVALGAGYLIGKALRR
ncbi:MAG TPA: hypothetical protein VIH53_13770 [Gemmatimonadaceae bacterium]|jgi:hypothetical protein